MVCTVSRLHVTLYVANSNTETLIPKFTFAKIKTKTKTIQHKQNSSKTWNQTKKLISSDGGRFGDFVTINNHFVAAGADGFLDAAYIFEYNKVTNQNSNSTINNKTIIYETIKLTTNAGYDDCVLLLALSGTYSL